MANTRAREAEIQKILSDDETTMIYDVLARKKLDIASRYKFLKQYRRTDEGMKILLAVLKYATKEEQDGINYALTDRSDIAKRVIEDLQANIRMGRLAKTLPFFDQKNETKLPTVDSACVDTLHVVQPPKNRSIY